MGRRRELDFGEFGEVVAEVDRLLAGSDRAGRWSLGQALYHLATAIGLSTTRPPSPDGLLDRRAAARKRLFFRAGRFPDGQDLPDPSMEPPLNADEQAESRSLAAAIRRFEGHEGPLADHSVLGPMTRDEWDAFHRLHCAHHLGFFRPTPAEAGESPPPDPGGVLERGPA